MAKQTGIITLIGRVGRLSFYKTKDGHLAREKGGVSRSRILNDPRFARTRENIREFTDNAQSSKLFRDAIRPVISKIGDRRLAQRLTQTMMQVLKSDELNVRGERKVRDGDWSLLQDMELNEGSSLGSTLFFELQAVDSENSWDLALPAFVPRDMMAVPSGASHYKIAVTGVGLDFESGTRTVVTDSTAVLSVLDESSAQNLSVDKTALSGTHYAFLVSVEFIQIVNGSEYSINNGAHNPAKIMGVSTAG